MSKVIKKFWRKNPGTSLWDVLHYIYQQTAFIKLWLILIKINTKPTFLNKTPVSWLLPEYSLHHQLSVVQATISHQKSVLPNQCQTSTFHHDSDPFVSKMLVFIRQRFKVNWWNHCFLKSESNSPNAWNSPNALNSRNEKMQESKKQHSWTSKKLENNANIYTGLHALTQLHTDESESCQMVFLKVKSHCYCEIWRISDKE